MPNRPAIIGHHLIWTLYGHWLPNDLRGSGSQQVREQKLVHLAPVHHGRKPAHLQPKRQELRDFFRQANPLLDHRKFWLDAAKRQAIGETIGDVVSKEGYTVWACAVLSNHAHLVIRRHRDDALTMWHRFADASRLRLREFSDIREDHPAWSRRPYKVFLKTPEAICSCVNYVKLNPEKERLPRQEYCFVQPYNNWPFHKRL